MIAMDLDGTVLRADQTIHPSLIPSFAKAQALGMTYRQYTAVLLDRGVHL